MKHIVTYFLYLILCFTHFIYAQTNNTKTVIWTHGLNYSTYWNQGAAYPNFYSSYRNNQYNAYPRIVYVNNTSYIGVKKFAEEINEKVNINPKTSIAVGHSMGGLALRHIDVNNQFQKKIGGIITVGAPLNGAQSMNSLDDGTLKTFLYNSVVILTDPIAYALFLPSLKELQPALANYLEAFVLKEMFGGEPPTWNTKYDLSTNIGPMANSNIGNADRNIHTQTPKINIYGDEYNPPLYNLLQTVAPDTYKMIGKAKDIYCVASYIWINPALALSAKKAYNYLNEGIHAQYAKVIGSYKYEERTTMVETPEWHNYCMDKKKEVWSESCTKVSRRGWRRWIPFYSWICRAVMSIVSFVDCTLTKLVMVMKPVKYTVPVIEGSDGMVPISSQIADGSSWKGYPIRAEGVNHMEMNGHPQMTVAFNNIFEGRVGNSENEKIVFNIKKTPNQ